MTVHPFAATRDIDELEKLKTDHFNEVWAKQRDHAQRLVSDGERSLARAVRIIDDAWRDTSLHNATGTAFGQRLTLPRAALFGARQAMHVQAAIRACRQNTDLVVELGSGWGINILDIFTHGGPRTARYRAMELSESGRACSKTLAGLEPELDFEALPFNYYRPDYSGLPSSDGHALVFTSHSIEQIRELPISVFTELLRRNGSVTGVHFEPVGWQINAETGKTSEVGATRENSARAGYNENLWLILQSLQERGQIRIVRADPDIIGHKTKNVSSLIIWQSV